MLLTEKILCEISQPLFQGKRFWFDMFTIFSVVRGIASSSFITREVLIMRQVPSPSYVQAKNAQRGQTNPIMLTKGNNKEIEENLEKRDEALELFI